MNTHSPGQVTEWLSMGRALFLVIHAAGVALFCFVVTKRVAPLLRAERDFRFDRPLYRLARVLQFWLGQ